MTMPERFTVVYVDDQPADRRLWAKRIARGLNCEVFTAGSASEFAEIFRGRPGQIDVVVTDKNLGGDRDGGFTVLELAKESCPVIMLTGFGDVDSAVKCLEGGGFTYVEKGLANDGSFAMLSNKISAAVRQARLQREVARQERELAENRRVLEKDLQQARRLQASWHLLAPTRIGDWDVGGFCEPCGAVGGDFLFINEVRASDGFGVFAFGDVVGHGVTSALLAARLRSELEIAARLNPLPQAVFEWLRLYSTILADGYQASLVYGTLSQGGTIEYFSAGHPDLIFVCDGRAQRLPSTTGLLCTLVEDRGRTHSLHFEPLDTLVIYSDGLTPEDSKETLEALERAVSTERGRTAAEHSQAARALIGPQHTSKDDVSVLVVQRGAR